MRLPHASRTDMHRYFERNVKIPHVFEDFRRSVQGRALEPLVAYLADDVHHPALVSALLYVLSEPCPLACRMLSRREAREMVGADCMHIGLSRATSLLSKRRATNQASTKLADMPVSMSRGNSSVTLRTGMSLIFSCLSFLVLSLRAAPARSRRGTAAVTQTASVRPQRTKELLSWRMYLAVISTRTLKWLLMHALTH